MKRHIIGIIIALVLAFGGLLFINLLMSNEIVVSEEVVINEDVELVYDFIEKPTNVTIWIKDLSDKKLEYNSESDVFSYDAGDDLSRSLKFVYSKAAKGVEIKYSENGVEKGVFIMKLVPQENQTIVKYVQHWNVGWNPIAKIMANSTQEKAALGLKKDLLALKRYLEFKAENKSNLDE